MHTCLYALLLRSKDIIALPLLTAGRISKCNTLSNGWIECPLFFKHSTGWFVTWWVDGLLAGISTYIKQLLILQHTIDRFCLLLTCLMIHWTWQWVDTLSIVFHSPRGTVASRDTLGGTSRGGLTVVSTSLWTSCSTQLIHFAIWTGYKSKNIFMYMCWVGYTQQIIIRRS